MNMTWYEAHKLSCHERDRCTRCGHANDNPGSLKCKTCTEKHRVYQNKRMRRQRYPLAVVIA